MPQAASDLPGKVSSHSLPPVDQKRTKTRVWNGYVCPGCRSVFRAAADFRGSEVVCPSCHEILRLPGACDVEKAQEIASPAISNDPPTGVHVAAKPSSAAAKPINPPVRTMFLAPAKRIKVAFAVMVPLIAVAGILVIRPWSSKPVSEPADVEVPPAATEINTAVKPIPPPPPVAVSEMPDAPANPPSATVEDTATTPEMTDADASSSLPEPLPEIPDVAAGPAVTESKPVIPLPAASVIEDEELVDAIPADSAPPPTPPQHTGETPAPLQMPAAQASAPADIKSTQLVHTVARGDTLYKISRAYRVGIGDIRQANHIKGDVIRVGQKLQIPSAAAPPRKRD